MPFPAKPFPDETILPQIRGACGHPVPAQARFCAECGKATQFASQLLNAQAVADVTRRPLTVLFCDLVDSCQLTATLELECFRDTIRSYQDKVAEVVGSHEGFVARYMGDGVLAYFGYPSAREDDAERAVRAGLALLQAVAVLESKAGLQLRVGIATGAVIVDKAIGSGMAQEIPIFGSAANLASRLLSITPPGSVVVDETTRLSLGRLFKFNNLGRFQLKGFAASTPAWHVVQPQEIQTRFAAKREPSAITERVGRDEEIAKLLAHAHHSVTTGLRVVAVTGDPGVGKSRLLHEVSEQLLLDGGTVLSGDCTPGYQGAPFMVLMDAFRRAFGLSIMALKADVRARLSLALKPLSLDSDENAALLLNLLGLTRPNDSIQAADPLALRRDTQSFLTRLLEAICARGPAVLVLEDVQWIDPLSREFLQGFVQTHATLRLLLIISSRTASASDWKGTSRDASILLRPLSSQETERLVIQRSVQKKLPHNIVQAIVRRSEGNPLFAEELLTLFMEKEAVPADQQAGDAQWTQVPNSVAHITICRLDRLSPLARRLLGIASTIGMRFSVDLLAAVAGVAIDVVQATLQTGTEAIVYPAQTDVLDYQFKHALVHDAVFATLLVSHRRLLHAQIAAELERRCADRPEAHAEALAHHFAAAGDIENAVKYLLMSGDKRFAIYALKDADDFFRSAIELVDKPGSPAQARVAEIVIRRMRILELAGEFGAITAMAEAYLPISEAQGNSVNLCLMLASYGHALLHCHNYGKAAQVAARGLELSERLGALVPAAHAKLVQMKVLSARDDGRRFLDVVRLGSEIIEMSQKGQDSYLACAARFQLALHYLQDGELTLARQTAHDLAEQGQLYGDTRAQSFSHWLLGWIFAQDRQFEVAMRHAEQSLSTAVTEVDRNVGLGLKGTLLALTGRPAEGLELLRSTRTQAAAKQDMNLVAALDPALGMALILTGRVRQGIRRIETATRQRERDGYAAMAFYGRLLLGEVYVAILTKRRSDASLPTIRGFVQAILFLVYLMPLAKVLARRNLKAAACNPRWQETNAAHVRIKICLGILASRRNAAAACEFLADARSTASAGGYSGLEQAAATALAAVQTIKPVRRRPATVKPAR